MRKKASNRFRFLVSVLIAGVAFTVQATDNIPPSGLQYINTNYKFIYHGDINMSDRLNNTYWENESSKYDVDYQYEFLGERIYDHKIYSTFVLTCQTRYEHPRTYYSNFKTEHTQHFYHVFLRQENGKVFARIKTPDDLICGLSLYGGFFSGVDNPDKGKERARLCFYGSEDEEVVIYDNNLAVGETYCPTNNSEDFGTPENENHKRLVLDEIATKESFLSLWNDGRLTLEKISYDDAGREVRTFRQDRTEWWNGYMLHDDTAEEAPESRTFEFIEGIGCTKGFLFNPGMYPPYIKPMKESDMAELTKPFASPSITLLRVIDKRDGSIVYENKSVGVKDVAADEAVFVGEPEYYNLQGFRVENPRQGEIYIVRQGSKSHKEVYRAR